MDQSSIASPATPSISFFGQPLDHSQDLYSDSSSLPSHLLSQLDNEAQLLGDTNAPSGIHETWMLKIQRHWRNERLSPDILPFEFDLVESMAGHLTDQVRPCH